MAGQGGERGGGVVSREYRIVKDQYGEFMPQVKGWFGWNNLKSAGYGFRLIENAEQYARDHANPVVKSLGKLP